MLLWLSPDWRAGGNYWPALAPASIRGGQRGVLKTLVLPFRHDAFESHLAGVGEDGRAVAFHVLVEAQAKASFGQHASKRGLAHFQRITPQVVAVQLDQVESVEEGTVVMAVVANEIERGNAVVIAGDSFAVDDAGARAQARQRLDDQREAAGEVVARTTIEPHSGAVLPRDNPKTVVFDLVQPLAVGWQLIGFGRKARRAEPGRVGSQTQHNADS